MYWQLLTFIDSYPRCAVLNPVSRTTSHIFYLYYDITT